MESVKFEVWSVECDVGSVMCVECELCSVK